MTFEDDIIYESDSIVVCQDREVPIVGFYIVSTKKKVSSILEIDDDVLQEMILVMKRVRDGMKQILSIDIVYLFQNEDSKHGFHFWMFPKHSWMDIFEGKIQAVKPIMNYAEQKMMTQSQIDDVKSAATSMKNYLSTI